jgi:two-component system chemotaxis response regulator CheY
MSVDKKMPILIVDDVQFVRREVKMLLRKLGFDNVDAAENGRQALEMMRSGKGYGLVISDWIMEPMSGIELLHEIRRDENLRETPFIMITGNNQPENVIAAKKAGVSSYVVKPFNATTLKQRLESVFGRIQ